MNEATFEAALAKFQVVRSADWQGAGCRPLDAAQARQHRERAGAARAKAEADDQKRLADRRQRGQASAQGSTAFYARLEKDLTAAGYPNVPAILNEFKNAYEAHVYSYNLEEVEQVLSKTPAA